GRRVSRISILPPELITEIFVHGLPSHRRLPSRKRAPLLLLQICRLWREIALTSPRLWAHLAIHLSRAVVDSPLAPNLSQWLSRARGTPVTLTLRGSAALDRTGAWINSLLRRYADLHLHVLALQNLPDILSLAELHTLTLSPRPRYLVPFHPRPIDTFRYAAKLREVALTERVLLQLFPLPWPQITRLTADGFTMEDCLAVLRDAPLLRRCTFGAITQTALTSCVIRHTSIEELNLFGPASELIPILDLPILRSLSL
ncbi:hypothetical protein FB451DRAFT_1508602, partial [Mycena latifolia]